jgi:outer membrane protein assembly factor BamE (lipoprotein component of BamABCDE complex)
MTNRFAYLIGAIVVTFLLTGCQTTQKSGSTAAATPSAKVESPTDTQTVKGINDWEGEITGKPAPGSKFTKLKIGMSMKQVTDLIGPPTDQGAYITGKAWIPFYYGSDRYRHELVYKGQGRLIFAGGSRGDYSSGYLTSIIHNAKESGYR